MISRQCCRLPAFHYLVLLYQKNHQKDKHKAVTMLISNCSTPFITEKMMHYLWDYDAYGFSFRF
jgi:hypothetical protein